MVQTLLSKITARRVAKATTVTPKPTEYHQQAQSKSCLVDCNQDSLSQNANTQYAPTEEEQSAEAILIGLIESGVTDFDQLFTQFFVDTKRSGWSHAYLEYLEDKYADSIVL